MFIADKRFIAVAAVAGAAGTLIAFSEKISTYLPIAWAEEQAALEQKVETLTDRQVKGFMDLYDIKLWKYMQTFPPTEDKIQSRRQDQILNEVRREQKIYENEYIRRKSP